ncbi:unnamed protein product [Vitrella brassicaformis CCMP3155]|uniref:Uncharacterized protein n=1 Tax=Vitrella brassicaformis (strain CCMP3155) TaxID=1169540 RepID=A0A0G4FPS8_VITBC|nr:unnamed protein product [Vitrella brassicaformis CCMP3155]|eukprot:CEM16025.1 unnamed protein product [Vitrella brassicaformis CCMP3155]
MLGVLVLAEPRCHPVEFFQLRENLTGEDKPFHPVQHLHLDKPKGPIDTPASLLRQGRTASIFGTGKPRDEEEILQRKEMEYPAERRLGVRKWCAAASRRDKWWGAFTEEVLQDTGS